MKDFPVVISCEHAGNYIPARFHSLFAASPEVLTTHRGWDIGALPVAQQLAEALRVPLFYEETSRLLIEMNRSLHHPSLFSSFALQAAEADRLSLIESLYLPYRRQVIAALEAAIQKHQHVLHLSIHTFTPVFNEQIRPTDVGLLFDPAKPAEQRFCEKIQFFLRKHLSGKQIDFNLPYQGTDDGFTTFLRSEFPATAYSGIEIEINQKYAMTREMSVITEFITAGIRNFYTV